MSVNGIAGQFLQNLFYRGRADAIIHIDLPLFVRLALKLSDGFQKRYNGFDLQRNREVCPEEVVGFHWIGKKVIELCRLVVGRAGDDFPMGCADAAKDRAVVADPVVEDDGDFGQGFAAEGGREGSADPVRRRGDAGEVGERRREVDQSDLLRNDARRRGLAVPACRTNHKRDAEFLVEERVAVGSDTALPEGLAVVGAEHDDGVLAARRGVDGREEVRDAPVRVADLAVVGGDGAPAGGLRDGLAAQVPDVAWRRNGIRREHPVEGRRRQVVPMDVDVEDEEEERLLWVAALLDPILREARQLRALGGLAGDVARRGVGRARERVVVVEVEPARESVFAVRHRVRDEADRLVAGLLQRLRERDDVRRMRPSPVDALVDVRGNGRHHRHDRRLRPRARCDGLVEPHRARGEGVDRRRRVALVAVASEVVRPQTVHENDAEVRSVGRGEGVDAEEKQGEDREDSFHGRGGVEVIAANRLR